MRPSPRNTRFHSLWDNASSRGRTAFTLIELLVACAVLALITVLIAQIVGMTSNAISSGSKKLVGMAQARFSLDRLGADLLSQINRADVDRQFVKADGNDRLLFYSEVDSVGGERHVSAICYRIQEGATDRKFQLERGVKGTGWSGSSTLGFLPSTLPSFENSDCDVLADGVLRMEFSYLKTDGTLSNTAKQDLSDVSAMVVAIAVLDTKSRKILTADDLKKLSDSLPDSKDGEEPIVSWQKAIVQPNFGNGIPRQGHQALRCYQRYYNLYGIEVTPAK